MSIFLNLTKTLQSDFRLVNNDNNYVMIYPSSLKQPTYHFFTFVVVVVVAIAKWLVQITDLKTGHYSSKTIC